MLLQPAERFLFIGDSITGCGRGRRPAQWGSLQELGDGYVRLVLLTPYYIEPDRREPMRSLPPGTSAEIGCRCSTSRPTGTRSMRRKVHVLLLRTH